MLIAIALFFLVCADSTVSDIPRLRNQSDILCVDTGLESNTLGYDTDFSDNAMRSLSSIHPSKESSIRLSGLSVGITDLVFIFANITTDGQYMAVIENNTLLNAKYDVYAIAQDNITINGVYYPVGSVTKYIAPFPPSLTITNGTIRYFIRLRQIDSLDDIEDSDRPINQTAQYYESDLISVAISGIPAVLASLAVNIAVLVLWKSQNIQEGLPNDV